MSRRRVVWHGPLPKRGDFLATASGNLFEIGEVAPARGYSETGLVVLGLRRAAAGDIAMTANVHPASRASTSLALEGPASVRQIAADGPNAVMADSWRDPDDLRPTAARRAREVRGFRAFCPLRQLALSGRTEITEEHILAADFLRSRADVGAIGFGAVLWTLMRGAGFGPVPGLSAAQEAQAVAARQVSRVFAALPPVEAQMLAVIVLGNRSLKSWTTMLGKGASEAAEMRKLVLVLDWLAERYAGEVEDGLRSGSLLPPEPRSSRR